MKEEPRRRGTLRFSEKLKQIKIHEEILRLHEKVDDAMASMMSIRNDNYRLEKKIDEFKESIINYSKDSEF